MRKSILVLPALWGAATILLATASFAQTYTSMSVTASFNGYTYEPNMTRVLENLWEGDFFLYLPTNKFVFSSGVSTWWGETNQTAFVPPLSGTAETNPTPIMGKMIILTNTPLTWHRFRFNPVTQEYSVWAITNTTSKLPPIMTIAGTFNNWQANIPNMEPVSYNVWQGDFFISAPTGQFKFTINNWQYQYGDTNQPGKNLPIHGVAEQVASGYDIQFTNVIPGYYRITFNAQTFAYSMRLLYSETSGVNLARNSSFEVQGSTSQKARHWEWGVPDTNGSFWGTSPSRETWRSHSGSAIGTLRGIWSGGNFGGFWQHSSAIGGRTYRASAWFWNDPNWTCALPELKIEFYSTNLTQLDYNSVAVSSTNAWWTRNSVTATAPTNAVGVRVVIAMSGAGDDGALQFDDVELRPVSGRTQDFETWPLTTNDTTIESDWALSYGRIISNRVGGTIVTGGVFFSEYVEGSANNKALEVYNATTNAVNLAAGQYFVQIYANGTSSPTYNIALTGTVAAAQTYVLCHSSATQTIKDVAQFISGNVNFNGDDAIVLRIGGTSGLIIDRFGRVGEDPGTSWGGVTADRTLRRKPTVRFGDTNAYGAFDPLVEWQVYPNDTFDDLGNHVLSSSDSSYIPAGRGAVMHANLSNYLQSAEIDGGIGNLSFWYCAEASSPAMTYLVQTSPDGVSWSNASSFVADSTEWTLKSIYIYQPEHSYVRLLHSAGTNRLCLDEIVVAEPVSIMRVQDFSLWTDPIYTNHGTYELNLWQISQGYVSTNRAYADLSCWLSPSNTYVRSPRFDDGAGEVSFRYRRASSSDAPLLVVQTSPDLTNWVTRGSVVVASTSTYQQASVYLYEPNPAYVRILCVTNPADTDTVSAAYALLDEIAVQYPQLYRSQNFDLWPVKNNYAGESRFKGWVVSNAMVNSSNAYIGQSARLHESTVSGSNAYIMTPPFPDGVGNISFQCRKWSSSETSPQYQIQTSTNGTNWIVRGTLTITNGTEYQSYNLFLNDSTARYVRIYHAAASGRALFDDISVAVPQPAATLVLNGWHDPTAPYVNDFVYLWLTAVGRYGATNVSVTSYYRIGTSGAFTAMGMIATNIYFYRSSSTISPQPTGTIVQYYFRADFGGPAADLTSPLFYPAGGSNAPAWYGIPRARSGQVWINELSYAPIGLFDGALDTNEFVELCGPGGFDLSGWTLVLVYGDQFTGTNLTLQSYAHYRIPNGTLLNDETNGYGFFVIGDNSWGPGVVDMTFTNFTQYDPGGAWDDNLADGHPDGLLLLNEMGGTEYQISYEGYMPNFRRVTQSQDYFESNSVALTGTGSNFENFAWMATNPTPGRINRGQTLVPREEPSPSVPPAVINVVRMVWTTNVTIYTSGNTNTTPWNIVPYYTTNALTPVHSWTPLSPYNSVYEGGGTNRFWFSPDTNRPVEFYYFRALPP